MTELQAAVRRPTNFVGVTAFAMRAFQTALPIALLAAAIWVLSTELSDVNLAGLAAKFRTLALPSITSALTLTAVSFLLLGINEWLALRYAGKALPLPRAAQVSFVSNAFGNLIGINWLTGGSVRYRMYARDGLNAYDTATVTAYSSAAFALGSLTLAGIALLAQGADLERLVPWQQPLGVLILIAVASYFAFSLTARGPLKLGTWSIAFPTPIFAGSQIILGAVDMIAAAGVVYVLMPANTGVTFATFAGIYTIATWAGLISYVPGGLGVFETAMILLLPNVPKEDLLASLLAYRAVYYLVPLLVGAGAFSASELALHGERIERAAARVERRVAPILAPLVGILVFLGGVVLLLSGATPEIDARMNLLKVVLPLPLIELSHLIGSLSGTALLVLARGLFRRLDGAYFVSVAVLVLGIAVSLLKGLDFEEAIVLAIILSLLLVSRSAFYRRSSLLTEPFTTGWMVAIAIAVIGSIWVGVVAYRDVQYGNELWLNFAFEGDVQRFMRASLIVGAAAVGFGLLRLMRPKSADEAAPDATEIEHVKPIALAAADTLAQLALTGDKHILFSPSGKSFLMYAARGRSWITLAGPYGLQSEARALAWRFREMCDAHDVRPVFYQIATADLPLCLDLGLSITKLGEEAHVSLPDFTLDGKKNRDLRLARNRAARDGLTFEVIAPQQVVASMDELKSVSDTWLAKHHAAEKGFSLGFYSPDYLAHGACAVIRRERRIIAFANLLQSAGKEELSVDLMRHACDGVGCVMDFLFAELLLWGKARGFRRFNLGMAPLSGLENRPLAPLWHRVGSIIFRRGDAFYNFEGLRQFKEKFCPEWQPRYIASPGGFSLPVVLLDVGALVSGGYREMISK